MDSDWRVFIKLFLLLIPPTLLILNTSCTPKNIPPPEHWPLETKAINLNYKADDKLNLYGDKPHTMIMCIYQLTEPNAFNNLRKDQDGLVKLLECSRFDKSVASNNKIFVYPGDEDSVILDRGENVKYFGVVAGYYNLWSDHVSHLFVIPTKIGLDGWIIKKPVAKPAELTIQLYLGPQEILEIGE